MFQWNQIFLLGLAVIGARLACKQWYTVGSVESVGRVSQSQNQEIIFNQIKTVMIYYDNIFELRNKVDYLYQRMIFEKSFENSIQNSQQKQDKVEFIRNRLKEYIKMMRNDYPSYEDFETFMTEINKDLDEIGGLNNQWDYQADKVHELLQSFLEELTDGKLQYSLFGNKFPEIEATITELNKYNDIDIAKAVAKSSPADDNLTRKNFIVVESLIINKSMSMLNYFQGINLQIKEKVHVATLILNQSAIKTLIQPLQKMLNSHKDMRLSIVEMYGIELLRFKSN